MKSVKHSRFQRHAKLSPVGINTSPATVENVYLLRYHYNPLLKKLSFFVDKVKVSRETDIIFMLEGLLNNSPAVPKDKINKPIKDSRGNYQVYFTDSSKELEMKNMLLDLMLD